MWKYLHILLILIILQIFHNSANAQIDVPKWMDDIGGPTSSCISSGVQVDKQNNVYVTGLFSGTADFDPSSGVYTLTAKGQYDTFVAKYTTNGTLIWAVSMGGSGSDIIQVNSLAVDINGNPIISGQFDSSDFDADPGTGTTILSTAGGNDAFIIKLNTNGQFMWAHDIGGELTDYGGHLSTDSQGNVIDGIRYEATVTVGGNTYTNNSGGFNGLTIKYDPNGNVIWAINLADATDAESDYSGIDSQDNIVVTGHFSGNDNFNPLGAAKTLNGNGNGIFIAKYTSAGILLWVQEFNGSTAIVCVDSQNDIFVDGPFSSPTNFNGTILNNTGSQDLFLAKYSSTGVFQYAKDIGASTGTVTNYGILASLDDNVYISGYFTGTVDFDPSPATTALLTYHGQQDFFLAKYDGNLNYKWVFGGGNNSCSNNLGRALGIDYNNNVLFTGSFCSTVDFSASSCTPFPLTAQSNVRDCFLGKYVQNTGTNTSQITSFSVPQQTAPAVIDQTKLLITLTVPAGTNITALIPTITYTSGVTISPGSGVAENFTSGVTYTLTANCSTLNYTVNIVFSETPKPLTVCAGNTTTLTGDTLNPAPNSYLWQTLQNNIWSSATGTNNTTNYITPVLINNTGANIVVDYRRQTVTAGDTAYDSSYDITVLPQLTNNTITNPANAAFCMSVNPGNIVGSTPTGGAGTYTYQWQISSDGVTFTNINGATGINYDPPALTSTTYYQRIVTSGTCGISTSNVISIIINQPPAPPNSIVTQTCSGTSATITISDAQAGLTYNWYSDANRATLVFTGTTYVTGPISTTTTFYIEAANASCTSLNLATAQVVAEPLPTEPSVNNSIITTCSGSQLTLSIVNAQTGYTYNWYTAATGGTPVSTGIDFVTPILIQTTSYYAEAVDANGCISAIRTPVSITVAPLPDISAQGAPDCPGSSAVLSAQSLDANTNINWYADATGGSILFTGSSFTTPDLSANTTYYAEAVDKTTGCVSTTRASATVTILTQLPPPVVTLENASPTALTFQWTAVPGATGYQVSTDNGVTFTAPSSGSNGTSTTISNLQEGQTIILIVEAVSDYSCQTSNTSVPITAIAQYPQNDIIYVANAFTPNGDGKNDIVYVHGNGIESMNFHIYDQFGELIFTSNSLTQGWDGTYKGNKQPVGVYVYYVQATMYNGQSITKKGTITLLR
jgi:gliding motility-associated-like protein